jgi:heme/copper-type cytochrome/quinol oxidase subunit 3
MGFSAFIAAYLVLRMASPQWITGYLPEPPTLLTGINTFILICSSVTMVFAYQSVCQGRIDAMKNWLLATLFGGIIFLSVQYVEWSHLLHGSEEWDPLTPWSSPYGATFYACTGYHGLHVLVGVIYIFCTWVSAMRGNIQEKDSSVIEILGLYWHFVDLVWILLFTIIYLIPAF